ncbi:EVE domain-containing protein [Ectothiorhodospira lacustris]|uniref:EVE domain-containing protein n=1 Tax=Ectothiorhodospira lacustris TaxID=2899127 RepID=UPI001EE7A1F1|nr:EVE domain-containing protein [Ectothiorhodospira lacustris]MCG5501035.1 EVE domain-containing protein [Ectothiorhodospira lacustris]MCG5508893.1 EVE domain-containing protein [Ectothiorhodospira lacustris]MCG5520684.1 EVE domain-containing protein [Ectothiorhodospira lacustris]
MSYWLMKSEPDVFGIDDLERVRVEPWEGVRNYQARNMMRDEMQEGDLAFFYHSNCKVPGIVGILRIVRGGYPDASAWDPEHTYHDPRSTPDDPRWYRVDVGFERRFGAVIPLADLKAAPALSDMPLVRRGNRLSIMPVTEAQWEFILSMAD